MYPILVVGLSSFEDSCIREGGDQVSLTIRSRYSQGGEQRKSEDDSRDRKEDAGD